jgi:hypothetical protein
MSNQIAAPTDLLDVPEAAARIRRSPATIRYWIQTQAELGPLFGLYGRRRMIVRADLEQWLASKRPVLLDHG